MAEKSLDAEFGPNCSEYSDDVSSKLKARHVDLATSFVEQLYGSSPCDTVVSDFAAIGNALDDLLAQAAVSALESDAIRGKYQETPIVSVAQSPSISTAHVTPQMTAAVLPPPPGFDIIDESETGDASSPYMHYYDQSCGSMSYTSSPSWRPAYPPPFHLGIKLFVGALPYSVTEVDLFPLFNQFGEILELHIQRDWLGRSKGCAWLRYSTLEECDAAIEALHNNYYLGSMNRPMQLTYASDGANDRKSSVPPRGRTQSFSSGSIPTGSASDQVVGSKTADQPACQRPRAMTDLVIPPSVVDSEQQPGAGGLLSKLRMISMSDNKTLKITTGLPSNFSENEIRHLFGQFGSVVDVSSSSSSDNTTLVVFDSTRDANRAKDTINGVTLPGCSIALRIL